MAISTLAFCYVQVVMGSRAGIVLPEKERYLVEARLLPLARQLRITSVEDLVTLARKENSDDLRTQMVDALLPKDTAFFRDIHPFELLRNQIFRMLEMKRFREQKLSIWCAGCSSGQEAFSIAMLLHRYFSQLLSWNLEIYATDLSLEALAKGRAGRFDEIEVHRGVVPVLIKEYFRRDGPHYVIKEEVSKLVVFDEFNLVGDWPELTPVDVVLLRNVVRFMNAETKKEILAKLKHVLKPDGYLLMGAQEMTDETDSSFTLVPGDKAVYYQPSNNPTSA